MQFSEASRTSTPAAHPTPAACSAYARRRGDTPPAFRVHVVGCPRSGTTLITELLRYAYEFHGTARHEQSLFEPLSGIQHPYLSKKPSDTTRICRALSADPDLYVIAMYRDPRAVITSKHWSSTSDEYYVDFPRWRAAMSAIERLNLTSRCITVRYEDLVTEPSRVQRHIEAKLRFLVRHRTFDTFPAGASNVPSDSQAALNGARTISAHSVCAWQNHLPRLTSELQRNPDIPRWLIDLGYERNTNWLEQLKGVAPSGCTQKRHRKPGLHSIEIAVRYWWRSQRYLLARKLLRRRRSAETTC